MIYSKMEWQLGHFQIAYIRQGWTDILFYLYFYFFISLQYTGCRIE